MAQDTDPGVGTGTPITGGAPAAVSPVLVPEACVSFERSLGILNVDHRPGAYGFLSPEACDHIWAVYQREGWIDKLIMAGDEIKRDLGAPLCPIPIYNELHPFSERIKLRQAPVSYLGRHTFSDWTEVNLTPEADGSYFELCEGSLGASSINDVQFAYPDEVLECYDGFQVLQYPCITVITGTCGGGAEDGYKVFWPEYQLVNPDVDETETGVAANFMDKVKWRTAAVDEDLAVELVGDCDCTCCSDLPSTLTVTLEDEIEGIVCINNCDPLASCPCGDSYIRVNYGTSFSYGAGMSPNLEEAVVMLALVKADKTPIKPCGCDNRWIDHMLDIDPTSGNAFAKQLTYGPTNAGMRVMRIMDKYLKRPHFNQPVMSGGLFVEVIRIQPRSRMARLCPA
jgi:hypothetical protein